MRIVNDFITADAFVIKDTKRNGEVMGLQINICGETTLSNRYGSCEVIESRMETNEEIWGPFAMPYASPILVLYI